MVKQTTNTHISTQLHSTPTTLHVIGDVSNVLHAACTWESSPSQRAGNNTIFALTLPDERIRFGLGAAAFGYLSEETAQQIGECVLIDGIPWWTPARRPSISHGEARQAELYTPFLFTWDRLDSAQATLDGASNLSLLEWYGHILQHPSVGKSGAIAVEVVARIPATDIIDKYICRAPLVQKSTLPQGKMIIDPEFIDTYFVRNTVCQAVPPTTLCTVVMAGIVVEPAIVSARWEKSILERGFYATPGMSTHTQVIHHTHAVVIPHDDRIHYPWPMKQNDIKSLHQDLSTPNRQAYAVHIENDTRVRQAIAHIGVIEKIETLSYTKSVSI